VQEAVNTACQALEDEKTWAVQNAQDSLQREHRQQLKKLQEELVRMQGDQRKLETRMKEQRTVCDRHLQIISSQMTCSDHYIM